MGIKRLLFGTLLRLVNKTLKTTHAPFAGIARSEIGTGRSCPSPTLRERGFWPIVPNRLSLTSLESLALLTILTLFLFTTTLFASDDKIILRKPLPEKSDNRPLRTHPQQDFFNQRPQTAKRGKSLADNNKLLVVLVDFVEDADPTTTGNGKFELAADPTYPISLGAPPHNRPYFEGQLEAVKYYYRAASFEAFQLDYDVYPKAKPAYTLSQEMAYYNPREAHLFTQRTEEYFAEVFATVDSDTDRPESFSQYGHYMIIHAGSDYQHDVMGDSYHDLPSYYLEIGTGKEVWVDGGTHAITHTANVPETITQDVYFRWDVWFGYGLVNAVYAHEFGHSLGFADLYNTLSGYPSVGMFDIMDSGGNGALLFQETEYSPVFQLESILPTLPSAWSRLLAWESDFLQRGILVDIDYMAGLDSLSVQASSAKRTPSDVTPYFYRIRLSADEYILIENRSVDPDSDGGTSVTARDETGTVVHPAVMLRPVSYAAGDYSISYEYDWLLPSWISTAGRAYGGGMLVWHIDDNQIYKQGRYEDGVFYNNYQLNTVNTNIDGYRAVRVIEADNLHDLGNQYSYFWTGTPWEYFFKYKPILTYNELEEYTYITGWTTEIYNNNLSATTRPPLKTNDGKPSNWQIYDISQANRVMTFKVKNRMFDLTRNFGQFDALAALSNSMKFRYSQGQEVAVVSADSVYYFTNDPSYTGIYDNAGDYVKMEGFETTTTLSKVDFPAVSASIASGTEDLMLVDGAKLAFLTGHWFGQPMWHVFEKTIAQAPFYFKKGGVSYIGVTFEDDTAEVFTATPAQNFNNTYTENSIIVESTGVQFAEPGRFFTDGNNLYFLTRNTITNCLSPASSLLSPASSFLIFDPVVYTHNEKSVIYLMSDDHVVYSVGDGPVRPASDSVVKILDLKQYTSEPPSQMALGYAESRNANFILVHTLTKVLIFSPEGAMYQGFPLTLENYTLNPDTTPYIISFQGEPIVFLFDQSQGLLAVDLTGKIRYDYSQFWNASEIPPQFFTYENHLFMLYATAENNVLMNSMPISNDTYILWNGFRNNGCGVLTRTTAPTPIPSSKPEIYIYPNPVKQKYGYLRINNIENSAKINIYNIAGQKVFTTQIERPIENFIDIPFDTTKLSSGLYFVLVETEGKTQYHKFSIIK